MKEIVATAGDYDVVRERPGVYEVHDDEGRCARVARFEPGPVISVDGLRIVPTALARAIAHAMVALADELDAEKAPG